MLLSGGPAPAYAAGILTQGGAYAPPVTASVAASLVGAQQAAALQLQSQNQLSRITTEMQAMQNMQTAARNVVITAPSSLPNGLAAGGLVPDSGLAATGIARPVTWVGANTPTQITAAGHTNVTINQTAAQAILSWQSFNVGKATTVDFNQQGHANWVALNQITTKGLPSQILGSIKADGQVYLINPNGIIFGGASQVNVGALIASTASISNAQFLADGIYSPNIGGTYTPSFTNAVGTITVQAGAQIATHTPFSVTNGGGYVLLMGAQVSNAGSIATPGGQAELAAGNNFLLRPGYDPVTNATSTTRGNEVGIVLNKNGSSALPGGAGLVTNSGIISAATGDITLAGETVTQSGVLASTTSVAVRGTIHLLSPRDDLLSSVTLTGNSLTSISPDLASSATALNSQRAAEIANSVLQNGARNIALDANFTDLSGLNDRQDESRVEIVTGGGVTFENGSQTVAHGGQVSVTAGSQFLAEKNAVIDVSGIVDVSLPVSSNDLAISVQSFEQRDAPQNRLTMLLRNNTVYVDARTVSQVAASNAYGSTRAYTAGGLLEVSGYLNTTGHTIGEWTSLGGTIAVQTGTAGAVIAQPGSIFNIAGGSVQYQGGFVQQSYLLGMNGQVYNVNTAPAYITYAGVYNGFSSAHARWGVTQTYSNVITDPSQIYEQGYTQGRAAGSLQLSAPTTIFAGTIQAGVVNGARQTAAPPAAGGDPYTFAQSAVAVPGGLQLSAFGNTSPLPGTTNVLISNASLPSTIGPVAAQNVGTTFFNARSLGNAGLGSLFVLTNGAVNVSAPLSFAPGAAVSLYGSSVTIAASITTHSGTVNAGNFALLGGAGFTLQTTDPLTGATQSGDVTLAAGAVINTTGLWTNLFLNPATPSGNAFINGGAVTLISQANLNIDPGGVIDASAGAEVAPNGTVTGGAGGALSLTVAAATPTSPPGFLNLRGSLRSIGYTAGGVLTISAPAIQIGNVAAGNIPATVLLKPAFFTSGFSSYNLNSSDGNFLNVALPASDDVAIAPGTIVNVVEPIYQPTAASYLTPTGAPPGAGAVLVLNPVYVTNPQLTSITQRPGASFSLTAGAITLGAGAAINVDPKQSITLSSIGQITIDGSLSAPGGVIDIFNPLPTPTVPGVINGQNTIVPVLQPVGQLSIWFGATSRVITAGQSFSAGSAAGNLISIAPSGGEILIGDTGGPAGGVTGLVPGGSAVIIAQAGAVFDASGTAASDRQAPRSSLSPLAASTGGSFRLIPVEGAGGSIVLASTGGIYNAATMRAFAGGGDAPGGTLNISLPTDSLFGPNAIEDIPRILTITQTVPGSLVPANLQPGMADPSLAAGTAQISAAQIKAGGFGTVSLGANDAIIFSGNVALAAPQSIGLYQGVLAESQPNETVAVNAPYVLLSGQVPILGQNFPFTSISAIAGFSAQKATGTFTVNADVIDLTNAVSFGGIESLSLPSGTVAKIDLADFGLVTLHSQGDLRLLTDTTTALPPSPSLISRNNIDLVASRIYALSGASGMVAAGYLATTTPTTPMVNPTKFLNISRPAGAPAATAPYELGGSLIFEAATINDSGVIWQPLGKISFTGDSNTISFLPGSVTSVSAAGLNVPFGGTTDGINYSVNGNNIVTSRSLGFGLSSVGGGGVVPGTITLNAQTINVSKNAVLDLSGGGNFTGAGFISGQGGSTDVLSTPLLQLGTKGGVTQPSLATDPVYAIVAGPQPMVAPSQSFTQTGGSVSMPALGAQIVIPAGVPGLPAGTYTLLPASYALEPGGYRVEFGGGANLAAAPVTALPNGSYAVAGYNALADTSIRGTLPNALTITPAATVQTYAQYDTQSYTQFLLANAARLGAVRPQLPADAGTLDLVFPALSTASLNNFGTSNFQAAPGGIGGTLIVSGMRFVTTPAAFDIYGAAPVTGLGAGTVSLSAAALDQFNPFTMEIGIAGAGFNTDTVGVTLESGATLTAARVVLTAGTGGITLKTGSGINTLGRGTLFADSTTSGFFADGGASVLDVGNGYLAYKPSGNVSPEIYGPITVQDGATIYTDGSIAFSTASDVTIGVNATYGGKYLDFALPEINVGDPALARAAAAPGLTLTQPVLQRLTAGVPALNVPAVQILVLSAGSSLNFFGTTSLDLSGTGVQLVIDSPAIYGFGGAGDVATVKAGTIVWNGNTVSDANGNVSGSAVPGGVIANGAGTGSGTLNFDASTILLGYSPLDFQIRDILVNRLTLGFATVNLNATSEITANTQGTLSVYQSQALYGSPGSGGTLKLDTPLLTADNQAKISFIAGGAITLAPPLGATPAVSLPVMAAGAEIDLTAATVALNSAVILPSGKLDINAAGNISFGGGGNINLAGATSTIVNKTIYGFGGTLIAESASGNITQDPGSVIDVAARNNNAGTVKLTATAPANGKLFLNGALLGSAAAGFNSGSFNARAQSVGDFTALNAALNTGGFFQARSFDIKQGDLTVGNGVKAHEVTISLDAGSLTVNGLIDASGNAAGSITLAAANNLTLASGAVLDAHGTMLQADQYGQPIASANAPLVNLTANVGALVPNLNTLTLSSGATINLASADNVARGDLELNVSRRGTATTEATAGDANIITQAGLKITGAATIAVNAFQTYNGMADGSKTTIDGAPNAFITQAYLDGINKADTSLYMANAASNADLASRLAGLKSAAGNAFHFRPGIEIVSATPNGDLTVQGDIDLSGYRYGPGVISGVPGTGEPGVLVLRAGGNLNLYGSITDGFYQGSIINGVYKPISDVGTPFATGWTLLANGEPYGQSVVVPVAVTLAAGSSLQSGPQGVNYAAPIDGGPFQPGAVAPTPLTVSGDQKTTLAFVATSNITSAGGVVLFAVGSVVPAGSTLPNNAVIATGGSFPFYVNVGNVVWPANTPFTIGFNFGFGTSATLSQNLPLLPGSLIPGGSSVQFPNFSNSVNTRPAVGKTQGQIYPLGQLLPAGDLSWSIQLVGGADITAADPAMVQPASALSALGTAGDITLSDTHYETSAFTPIPVFSVVRTGTGSLQLDAGGSITELSDYGIYTAGAQAPAVTSPYELAQGLQGPGNTLLGSANKKDAALAANYQANYPTNGGNVLVDAQGNLTGFINTTYSNIPVVNSDAIGSWLWRQGGAGQPGAWWVEFGALEPTSNSGFSTGAVQLDGFQGIGTLGGGNLTVTAGGDASGLNLAVASTGRVLPGGTVAQTGGGNLVVNIGGAINFATPTSAGGLFGGDAGGVITDLRGNIVLDAGSIGNIQPFIGLQPNDPRVLPPLVSQKPNVENAIELAPGDGTVSVTTRGDQVIDSLVNPGTVQNQVNTTPVNFSDGNQKINVKSGGATLFSLWSANTGVALFSAGGDVVPGNYDRPASTQNGSPDLLAIVPVFYYPPSLSVISQNGNINFVSGLIELVPAPNGSLQLLAANSIFGSATNNITGPNSTGTVLAMSGAPLSTLATPANPSIIVSRNGNTLYLNSSPDQASGFFAFGPDTPSGNLHAPGQSPALVYAGSGDIVDLQLGYSTTVLPNAAHIPQYIGAMPFDVVAGRDIINLGTVASPDLFLNLSPTDVTSITAGRDILQSSANIAGPGTLLLQAGRNLYQADQGVLTSIGPVFNIDPNNRNDGAGIVVIAGVGTAGPDYGNFENLYLNPASKLTLQNASQIIMSNDAQLYTYLRADYSYNGPRSGAYAYFMQHLSPIQRDVYLLNVYYSELNNSGLEYNNAASVRYRSYVRGKDAIAALFPGYGTVPGSPDTGDITLYGNSGIHTNFGGAIQSLTPGGQTIVGVDGTASGASAGFITQGSGSIDIYAQDSVLLGQSRVLTTFGGDILVWSATGDINAGRGSKTSIDYTPLQRVYDPYGNVSLSPTVPSSGGGIGTLNPIPQVAPGNINLVAPLGTVDAGEAGIRVSGNINIAALHVVNAANITVQGSSSGIPVSASPNVGALSAASNASGAAAQAAENTGTHAPTNQPSIWIVEVLGYGGGDTGNPPPPPKKKKNLTTQASLASFGGQA